MLSNISLIVLLFVLALAGCDTKKPRTAKQLEDEITLKNSFFNALFESSWFSLEIYDDDSEMIWFHLPPVEQSVTTVQLNGLSNRSACLRVISLGMNEYSGNNSVHSLPVNKKRATVIGPPVHLEIEEWVNKEKTVFKSHFGEEWKLISTASPTHSEHMKLVGLMGPGQFQAFYDEKGCFHARLIVDSGTTWEYQLKDDQKLK